MANYNVLTLSEPVADFVATTSPEAINVQCSLTEDAQRKRVWAVCKAGGIPAHPYDGVRVLMTGDSLVTAMISGLTNDTEYGVRLFVEGKFGYQTALEGATAAATPRAGQPATVFPVGTVLAIPMADGSAQRRIVVHQGLPSSMYDTSCNGTWTLEEENHESRQWHSTNVNNYKLSTIHSWLNGGYAALFNVHFLAKVVEAKIPYVNGTGGSEVASGANGLPCKFFLLGGYEVGFSKSVDSAFPTDGAKLEFFLSGTSAAANNKRMISGYWWLRSPDTTNSSGARRVSTYGQADSVICSLSGCGARPACIIPSDTLFSLEPNTDGSYSPIL